MQSRMDVEEGIGVADAERMVELHLDQSPEKLLQIFTPLCSPTGDTHSTHAVDRAAASFNSTHCNFRYNKYFNARDLLWSIHYM